MKIIAWSLLSLVCLLLAFALVVLGVAVGIVLTKPVTPIGVTRLLTWLTLFFALSGGLVYFYIRVARTELNRVVRRAGWLFSAIYHIAQAYVLGVGISLRLQFGPLDWPISLLCLMAAAASIYALFECESARD